MAWAEYQKIRSATRVAHNLGIPATTVRSWIRDYKSANNELPLTLRYENEQILIKQLPRIKKETSTDIHVNLFGKPPTGRSALDYKQEQQNEHRQANPFHINRYYRKPGQ